MTPKRRQANLILRRIAAQSHRTVNGRMGTLRRVVARVVAREVVQEIRSTLGRRT
jgi:hypothetical protein